MIVSAGYNAAGGTVLISASEPVTVLDGSAAPWSVTFDSIPATVFSASQIGSGIRLITSVTGAPPGTDARLSYAGGPFVQGNVSGLFLEPVNDFPVSV